MGFAGGAPRIPRFGIVLDMHGIAKIDAVIGSQLSTELIEPRHELALRFRISFPGDQTILLVM